MKKIFAILLICLNLPIAGVFAVEAGEMHIVYSEDFEDGEISDRIVSDIVFGDSVTVEYDSITKSNSMKIVKGNEDDGQTSVCFNFCDKAIKNGKVKIMYDIRFEYNGKYVTHLMSPFDKIGQKNIFRMWSYGDRFDLERDAAGDEYLFYASTSDAGKAKVHHVEYDIDLDNKKYNVLYTDTSNGNTKAKSGTYTGDVALDSLKFAVRKYTMDQTQLWRNGADNGANPGIYRIDNICVMSYGVLNLRDSTIHDGAVNINHSDSFLMTFDKCFDEDTDYGAFFELTDNCGKKKQVKVSPSDNALRAEAKDGFEFGKNYTLRVLKGLAAEDGSELKRDMQFRFATIGYDAINAVVISDDDGNEVRSIKDISKQNANVTVYRDNDFYGSVTLYCAVKNDDERLVALKRAVSYNEREKFVFAPSEYAGGSAVEVYCFKNNTINPLAEKTVADSNAVNLYVDKNSAADGNGSFSKPYNNLETGLEAVKDFCGKKVNVYIRGGDYTISQSLTIPVSGTQNAEISVRNYGNENVSVSVGRTLKLSDFNQDYDSTSKIAPELRDKVYKCSLSEMGIEPYDKLYVTGHGHYGLSANSIVPVTSYKAPELIFDGEIMSLARYPDEGYINFGKVLRVGDKPGYWDVTDVNDPTYVPENERNNPVVGPIFEVDDERVLNWKDARYAWVGGFWRYDWSDQTMPVKKIEGNTIEAALPSSYGIAANRRFYIFNLIEELDTPGEWYYDADDGQLYIYPYSDNPDGEIKFSFSAKELLTIRRRKYINIEGITFSGGRGTAVSIADSDSIVLDKCSIKNFAGSDIHPWICG